MEHRFKAIFLLFLVVFSNCRQERETVFGISYEAVNNRFKQSLQWNSEHPARTVNVASDNYQVWMAADVHVGSTLNLQAFFHQAQQSGASATFLLGDLTTGKQADFMRLHQQLPPQEQLPCFLTIGNHDLLFDGWGQFYELMGSSTYTVIINTPVASDLFVCLDTGSGTLGSDQLQWLEHLLRQERSKYRHCVLLTHYNLFRYRRTNSTALLPEEVRRLLDLYIKNRVDYVIQGHDHSRAEHWLGNTRDINLGAIWDLVEHPSCFIYTLNAGKITHQFKDL